MADWTHDLFARLAELKQSGHFDYDEAFRIALREHPPRGRDLGEREARLFDVKAGDREDTLIEFARQVGENAWHNIVGPAGSGNGPSLRYFEADLIREAEDSSPARRAASGGHRFRSVA